MSVDKSKKVIIIGAGPAGLTAAYELLKQGFSNVTILEETMEIGGISGTVKYNGNRIDIGGHRFFSKSDIVMEWWTSIMPMQGKPSIDDIILNREKNMQSGGPNPEKNDRVMLVRQRVSRIYYLRKFFDYPLSIKAKTFINMGLIRTIRAGFSYMWSSIFKRKEKSLEDYMINHFGRALYGMFFEKYTEKVWGKHPSEISPEWGAQRIKGLSILKILVDLIRKTFRKNGDLKQKKVETSLIEKFIYPKYGPGQLWETVAEEITGLGGRILVGSKVVEINVSDGKVLSVNYESNEKKHLIKGDVFLSSMPIKDLIESFHCDCDVQVPSDIQMIARGLQYRDFITVGLLVNKMKILNETKMKTINNIVPDCWIYIQEPDVKVGRLQVFNNWSPYMVKDYKNTIWIGLEYFCSEGDEMWNMNDSDFISFASEELEKIGIIDKSDILDAVRVKVKKAYPAYFGTYNEFNKVRAYLNTFENLYCIGRNGQHRYNNMDHSMLSAMEAVKNILSEEKSKENIWSVNTEEEYQEELTKTC